MVTYRGNTVTTALICNLSRKQSWVISLMHQLLKRWGRIHSIHWTGGQMCRRAGLMFWIERKSLASAKNKPHMAQHQGYHYTDRDAIGSNIPYCACQLRFHLQLCWGCICFQAKLCSVIYINYKARFYMQICWGCVSFRKKLYVSFSTKYYCVIHITSCRAAPLQYLSQY
jgi:hypothetical protein